MLSADLPYLQGIESLDTTPQATYARLELPMIHKLLTIYPATFTRFYNTVGEAVITIGDVNISLSNDGDNIITLNIREGTREVNMRMGLNTSRIVLNGVKIFPDTYVTPADIAFIQRVELLMNGYIQGYIDRDKARKHKCSCVLL